MSLSNGARFFVGPRLRRGLWESGDSSPLSLDATSRVVQSGHKCPRSKLPQRGEKPTAQGWPREALAFTRPTLGKVREKSSSTPTEISAKVGKTEIAELKSSYFLRNRRTNFPRFSNSGLLQRFPTGLQQSFVRSDAVRRFFARLSALTRIYLVRICLFPPVFHIQDFGIGEPQYSVLLN